jgi:hypothetical protein
MTNNQTPSEKFNLPVIGKIRCQLLIEGFKNDIDEFEVIQIQEINNQKIYICNQWNSYDVAQIVHSSCVLEFIPK